MATTSSPIEFTERCESCDRVTAHEITVELVAESEESEKAAFSREPYRVRECQVCGTVVQKRMNSA